MIPYRWSVFLLTWACLSAQPLPFAERFEEIKRSATKEQLYALLWAMPKGGDLHNHMVQSYLAHQWFAAAIDPKRTRGNRYFTQVRYSGCPGADNQFIRFRTIQRATWEALGVCEKAEFEALDTLSPGLRAEWISSFRLDQPGEGRNEFFEVSGKRRGDLSLDPYLVPDLLVEHMKLMSAQHMPYLETQFRPLLQDQTGKPIPEDEVAALLKRRLQAPDAVATGVTVRFMNSVLRYAPDAEQQVERIYAFLGRHRDLWVGMNMGGREDNDKGHARRFMDVHRRMRRTHPHVKLAFHGGEVDSPGNEVRQTLMLGAERIGHGVNLVTDPDTMLLMRSTKRFLVEINLVSNQLLEYTPDLATHPFPEYLRLGIPVCLNTDDPGSWDSNITDEYFVAVTQFNLTWAEIVEMGQNSLQHAFVEEPVKSRLLAGYQDALRKFEAGYGTAGWRKLAGQVPAAPSGYALRTLRISAPQ